MGYDFTIKSWYKIKHKEKEYPWPCEGKPDRMITLLDDDVLTKSDDGKFTIHTGMCCVGIIIPKEDLIKQDKPANLRLI